MRSVPVLVEVVCCESTSSELVDRATRNLALSPSKKPREVLGSGFFEGNILIILHILYWSKNSVSDVLYREVP